MQGSALERGTLLTCEFESKVDRVQERAPVHVLLYFLLWGASLEFDQEGQMTRGSGPALSTIAEQSDTSGEGGEETRVGCGGGMFGRRKSDL